MWEEKLESAMHYYRTRFADVEQVHRWLALCMHTVQVLSSSQCSQWIVALWVPTNCGAFYRGLHNICARYKRHAKYIACVTNSHCGCDSGIFSLLDGAGLSCSPIRSPVVLSRQTW